MTPARRAALRRAAGTAAVVVVLALTAAAHLAGVRAVPVLSGSMTPFAPVGSLVATVPLPPERAQVGDVIAFLPPAPFDSGGHPVLHRVHALAEVDGAPTLTTQGDANPGPDPWTVAARGADLGRAVLVVPWLGWLLMAGPVAALLVLVGLAAVAESRHALRRRACTCPHPAVTG